MGYACPVCGEPQADGEHLANHLAFSAMLGRADHADWLDEHAPGWDEEGPEALAERVTPAAEEVDLPGVDEDTELPDPPAAAGSQADPGGLEGALARGGGGAGRERLDPETREVIAEAREMTRRRQPEGDDGDRDADASGEGDDAEEADESDADPSDEKP